MKHFRSIFKNTWDYINLKFQYFGLLLQLDQNVIFKKNPEISNNNISLI